MWRFVLTVTSPSLNYSYNQNIDSLTDLEAIMGNSLHNKIYLGRKIDLHSRGAVALVCIGAATGLALVLLALRLFK